VTWSNPDSYTTAFGTTLKVAGAGSNSGLFMNDKPPEDCSSGGLAQSLRLDRVVGGTFLDYQEVGGSFIGDMWQGEAKGQGGTVGGAHRVAGRVVVYQDGGFVFVPARDFVGTAAFQYAMMVSGERGCQAWCGHGLLCLQLTTCYELLVNMCGMLSTTSADAVRAMHRLYCLQIYCPMIVHLMCYAVTMQFPQKHAGNVFQLHALIHCVPLACCWPRTPATSWHPTPALSL
jgi:hypothetical protein